MHSKGPKWIRIQVTNWDKFNPRTDVKHPSWFRVEHKLIDHPDLFDLTHEEFKALFYMLAMCCRENSDCVRLNYAHAASVAKLSRAGVDGAIEKLCDLEMLAVLETATLRARDVGGTHTGACVTDTAATGRDSTLRDETGHDRTGHDTPPAVSAIAFDFEALYRRYPLKKGKGKGIRACERQITTPEEYAALSGAIDKYAADVVANRTEPGFIKHFSSFMGSEKTGHPWRDWLDADAGSAVVPAGRVQNRSEQRTLANQQALADFEAQLDQGVKHG